METNEELQKITPEAAGHPYVLEVRRGSTNSLVEKPHAHLPMAFVAPTAALIGAGDFTIKTAS